MKRLSNNKCEEYVKNKKYFSQDDIGGSLIKKFIRIDSSLVVRYFDIISKGNSSYVSYADNLIKECYDENNRDENGKKILPLKYISVLLKDMTRHGSSFSERQNREVIGSKLSNLFGMPTVYNEQVEYMHKPCIASIDFLKDGETIESLDNLAVKHIESVTIKDINTSYDELSNMEDWYNLVKTTIICELGKSNKKRLSIAKNCTEDFCIQLLFKGLVLCDLDLKPYNFSFIKSKDDREITVAPLHDFEYILARGFSHVGFFDLAYDYFTFMEENNLGDKLKEFMNTVKTIAYKKGKFNPKPFVSIFESVSDDECQNEQYLNYIRENIEKLTFAYDVFKKYNTTFKNCSKMFDYYQNQKS